MSDLRFTGRLPPPRLFDTFPNWEYALDEEGRPGQDETTLRPMRQRKYIAHGTAFTSADAYLPGGECYPALLEMHGEQLEAIVVFEDDEHTWYIRLNAREGKWQPAASGSVGGAIASLSDAGQFPLRIMSRLPDGQRGKRIAIQILPTGFMASWDGNLD